MFLPTMTDVEIKQEAKKDFFELGTKIKMAFDNFCRKHCDLRNNSQFLFNDRPVSLINKNVETRTWRTRRNNTWTARFCFHNRGMDEALMQCFAYTPVRRERGTEYIFLEGMSGFMAERFTLHFIERYRERYLQPRGIDVGNMPTPLYFQLHNPDCILGRYYKTTDIGVEESPYKKFWIAPQGIYVTDYIEGMLTYITFMDKEGLSPLKQKVYEEEVVWNLLMRTTDPKLDDDARMKACYKIVHNENFCQIVTRFLRRNYEDSDAREENIRTLRKQWPEVLERVRQVQEEIERKERQEMRENRQTGKIPTRTLPEPDLSGSRK